MELFGGKTNLLGSELNDIFMSGLLMVLEKGCGRLGKKKYEKDKFARIGKYKYVTGILAFLITSGRTAGLIYDRPYVSQVHTNLIPNNLVDTYI